MFRTQRRSPDVREIRTQRAVQSRRVESTSNNDLWHKFATNVSPVTGFSGIQCKTDISSSDDYHEKEADLAARQVVADSDHRLPAITPLGGSITAQRMCTECEEELQRKALDEEKDSAAATITTDVPSTGGQPMSPSLRDYFEPRFNQDFSQIRLHTDQKAAASAADINARAYTRGPNIVFGQGEYQPASTSGRYLLAHQLTHSIQQGAVGRARHPGSSNKAATTPSVQRNRTARPTRERVWGLPITRSMCRCKDSVREGITWANTAASTYAACDTPANPTGTDVEACFDAAHPTSTTVATTSSSGTMTLPPASSDPCERIENKATYVHEYMHSRHADAIARAQGRTFYREWRRLRGDPDRLTKLRARFPAEVAAYTRQWNDGHDWAQDEVNSYKWERRFLQDALRALNRIC